MTFNSLKYYLLLCFSCLILSLSSFAQTYHDDWSTYSIPNVCSFKVPPTMEVRMDNSYQGRFVKKVHQSSFFQLICDECNLFFEEATLVLQPKGLNEDPYSKDFQNANSTYGRIMFKFGYNDIFSQDDIEDMPPSELTIIDTTWRNVVQEELECLDNYYSFDGKFVWYPLRKEKYSDLYALVTEYDRPGSNIETHVREYKFFYEDKFLRITMSYNRNHEAKYKDDYKTFMQLLKIETNNSNRSKLGQKGLFSSNEFHIIFNYDSKKFFESKKQNTSSHCILKLETVRGSTILLSAWDLNYSTESFSIHDDEIINEMKQQDKEVLESIIKSCEKVKIGNVKALMSKSKNKVFGVSFIYTTYRVFYKDRFYTIDFHIIEKEYNENKNIVDDLIKGLRFN